jgi:two-component system, LuxR family, sensor kinase FixL
MKMLQSVLFPPSVERDEVEWLTAQFSQPIWIGLLVGVAYYVGAMIGLALTLPTYSVSTLWPPNAILLASLLLVPSEKWWLVILGAFPAHLAVQLQGGVPLVMTLCWFISNSSEALIGAFCLRRLMKGPIDFASLKSVIVYVGCAVILAPFLSSFLDAAFVVLVGWKDNDYWQVWSTRFPSNVLAALTIPPAILLWVQHALIWLRKTSLRSYSEAFSLGAGLVTVSFVAFGWQTAGSETTPALLYLPLPVLLWAAMRFGSGGASLSLLVVVLASIYGAAQGRGPFIHSSPAENVFSLQMFLMAISFPVMFLAGLIEEQRHKASALSESEARFRAMADNAPVLIWMSDTSKLCTFFNKGWLDFTGRMLEQELGDGWAESVHPDDLDLWRTVHGRSFDARQEFAMEYRLRRHDGEYRWVLDNGAPRFEPDGTFLGYLGSCIDITERKRGEEGLEKQRAFLRQVIDTDPNFIFAKDREGRFTLANKAVADAYGTTVENLIGKSDADFNRNREEVEAFRRMDMEVLDTLKERFIPEERITDSDGKVHWLQTVKRPIIDQDGSANQILGAATDITRRKEAEAELQRNRRELAHVTRVSTMGELAASLAHELNQPLTAILSNAQAAQRFLAAPAVDLPELREILNDIVQDNRRAGEVIRRMRTLARKEEFDAAPLDLAAVIGEVILLVHSDAILHNVRVMLELDHGLPAVRGDKVQLQQVMLNLLLNAFDALKDCPADERQVSVRAEWDSAFMVTVTVCDRGTGVSRDKLDTIFEPFYSTKEEGLGMGLSISRSIVEAHGGRLWVENNRDRGATFYFQVPVEKSG